LAGFLTNSLERLQMAGVMELVNAAAIRNRPRRNFVPAAVYLGMMNDALSQRERQIVAAVARGLSNRDIASATGIAQQTVKNHLSLIFQKLNVRSRVQLAVLALRSGFADPPPM